MTKGRKPGTKVRRCSIDGCERAHYGHGFCELHWKRSRVHGDPNYVPSADERLCEVVGCLRRHRAKGLCASHYRTWIDTGNRPEIPIKAKTFRGIKGPCLREGCDGYSRGSGYCDKHRARLTNLLRQYNIASFEEFDDLWKRAGGCCEICGTPVKQDGPESERLHIDHSHTTGEVRGILCRACNQGIGQFKDTAELLDRASAYLRRQPVLPGPLAVTLRGSLAA